MSEAKAGWLSVREVAESLGLSRSVVYQMAATGQIGHYKVGPNGGRVRFKAEDVDAYLAKCRVGEPVARPAAPTRKEYVSKYDHSRPGRPLRRS